MHSFYYFLVFLAAMTFLINVEGKVTFQKGFNPILPGYLRANPDDTHNFFVVGDRNSIHFYTKPNEEGQISEAICGHIIPNSHGLGKNGSPYYTGPCEIDSSKQSQVLIGKCIKVGDPKTRLSGNATITWYPSNDSDNQRKAAVRVETQGNIWVGTTKDVANSPLLKGPFTLAGLQKEAILINCQNSNRTPIAPN